MKEVLGLLPFGDEVKDDLKKVPLGYLEANNKGFVSLGLLAVEPDVLLMDEPTSALDPISTAKIEELVQELKRTIP